MGGSDPLNRLAATDRLHGDPGLEPGAVGATLAHRWEPPVRGGNQPKRLTITPVQKNQSTSVLVGLVIDGKPESHGETPIELSTKPEHPKRALDITINSIN
jgi:hypothetical protein